MANKSLIFLYDGTWQDLNQSFPTNVVRLLEAIAPQTTDGKDQIVYYDEGIGTQQVSIEPSPIDNLIKIAGGALESLYQTLSGERSRSFDTILKVVSVLGLKLSASVRSEAKVT